MTEALDCLANIRRTIQRVNSKDADLDDLLDALNHIDALRQQAERALGIEPG